MDVVGTNNSLLGNVFTDLVACYAECRPENDTQDVIRN